MIWRGAVLAVALNVVAIFLLPTPAHGLVKSSVSTPYAHCLNRSAQRYRLAVELLKGIVATESNWDPNARSSANAHGLMQIQWPGTARHLGVTRKSQLYQPCQNIELGARYVRELLDRYQGNERLALAAYNYGPGRISADKPIPAGARKYVAKVHKNAALFGAKTRPAARNPTPVAAASNSRANAAQALVAFSSKHRADRYVRLLTRRIAGADFRAQRAEFGRYQVWMQIKASGLTRDERLILASLGWEL